VVGNTLKMETCFQSENSVNQRIKSGTRFGVTNALGTIVYGSYLT